MFRSLSLGGMSVASSASKSSAASSYDSSSKGSEWENDLTEKDLEIYKLTKYEISCLADGSDGQGWANFGIGFLNFFGGNYDYPDHWFLIAETKPQNFMKDILSIYLLPFLLFSGLKDWGEADCGKKKEVDKNKFVSQFTEKLISLLDPKNNKESNPLKVLHEIYNKEDMEYIVTKLKDMKNGKKVDLDFEKFTKVYYFLIEKGGEGKTVKYYENVNDILDQESENYHYNTASLKDYYYMNNKKITIKDLKNYVETLSDSYNVIDDNCQDFVRNILRHYSLI